MSRDDERRSEAWRKKKLEEYYIISLVLLREPE